MEEHVFYFDKRHVSEKFSIKIPKNTEEKVEFFHLVAVVL